MYQLTNIYTRGAVTEFFAYQLMLLGTVVLLSALRGRTGPARRIETRARLRLTGTRRPRAPTDLRDGGTVSRAAGRGPGDRPSFFLLRRRFDGNRWPGHWSRRLLYRSRCGCRSSVAQRAELGITQQASDLQYFPLSIDHWIARFWPFSIDLRVLTDGYNLVSTPFLSAPVNSMALLLAALALLGRYLRPLAGAPRNLTVHFFVAAASLAIIAPLLLSLPIVRTEPSPNVPPVAACPRPSQFHDRQSAWPDPIRLPARQHREPGGDPGCARDFTSPIADESRSAGMASARPRVALSAGRRGDSVHCRDWQQGARRAPGVHLAAADQPADHFAPRSAAFVGGRHRKRSRPTVWRCARSTRFRQPSTASDCTECRESTSATSKAPITTN